MDRRLKYKPVILGVLAACLLAACASALQAPTPTHTPASTATSSAVILTDGLGKQFVIAKPYQKIVSLAPSNTEILFAIGAGEQVVARDASSDYPAQVKSLSDIGGGLNAFNNEQIVALAPDLVLAAEINAPEQIKALQDLGLNVFYLANPKDFNGLYANLTTVAQLTGRQAETEALIASLKTRVADVESKVANATTHPKVFYELDGTDPSAPWTSGPGTFIDLLAKEAGGTNVGNMLNKDWGQLSLEQLVTQNPDMIVLGDAVWGNIKPEDVAKRAGWDALTAVKTGKVYPFDDNLISRPGPRLVDGLEQLAKLLHPDLFQ